MHIHLSLVISCLIGATALTYPQKALAQEEIEQDWQEELRLIDEEIKTGEDLKKQYLSTARRADDKGMSWQHQGQRTEARKAFQLADDKRQAAEMLQARIDALKARRAQILQEHPEAGMAQ